MTRNDTTTKAGARTQSPLQIDEALRALQCELAPFIPKGWRSRRQTYFGTQPDCVVIDYGGRARLGKNYLKKRAEQRAAAAEVLPQLLKTIRDNFAGVVAEINGEVIYVIPAALVGEKSEERETAVAAPAWPKFKLTSPNGLDPDDVRIIERAEAAQLLGEEITALIEKQQFITVRVPSRIQSFIKAYSFEESVRDAAMDLYESVKRFLSADESYSLSDAPGGDKFDELGFSKQQLHAAVMKAERASRPQPDGTAVCPNCRENPCRGLMQCPPAAPTKG